MWSWLVGNVNTLAESVQNKISNSGYGVEASAPSLPREATPVGDESISDPVVDASNNQSDSSEHELDSTEPESKQTKVVVSEEQPPPEIDKHSETEDLSTLLPALKEVTNSGLSAFSSGLSSILTDVTGAVKSAKLVSEFLNEEEQFKKKKNLTDLVQTNAIPPWYGYNEAEEIKTQILEISSSRRNLLREPPPGSTFQLSLDNCFGQAMLMLSEDSRLKQIRFVLVPTQISEEAFWRNYFYRVHLIKQSVQLGTLKREEKETATEGESINPTSVATDEIEPDEFVSDALDIQSSSSQQLTEEELNQLKLTATPTRKAGKPREELALDEAIDQELNDFNPDDVKDEDFDYADFENLLKDN